MVNIFSWMFLVGCSETEPKDQVTQEPETVEDTNVEDTSENPDDTGLVDQDGDGFYADEDCDDNDSTIFPGADDLPGDGIDQDCDGVDAQIEDTDQDDDGWDTSFDCDDLNPDVYPGAPELTADGVDQNCDGMEVCYEDLDDDGYGSTILAFSEEFDCSAENLTATDGDCDDLDATINPEGVEVSDDGIDQDCDGQDLITDNDGDGWGVLQDCDDDNALLNLDDMDADGYSTCEGDCDDTDDTLNNHDNDQDGFTTCDGDCDDVDDSIYPTAIEIEVDGIDQDCDGFESCYEDLDEDGFGSMVLALSATLDCSESLFSSISGDCDDSDLSSYPGGTELPDDGIDQDCDGSDWITIFYDDDLDGYDTSVDCDDTNPLLNLDDIDVDGYSTCDGDCDDNNAVVYPNAPEIIDQIDNNCNGYVDLMPLTEVPAGGLLITEMMINPSAVSDANGEWLEIFNPYGIDVLLQGLTISDNNSNFVIDVPDVISPGGFYVVGSNSDAATNGGAVVDFSANWNISLNNSGGDTITIFYGTTNIDVVSYTNSWSFGSGESLNLDVNSFEASLNDDSSYWCASTSAFGDGDSGTPNAPNEDCGIGGSN